MTSQQRSGSFGSAGTHDAMLLPPPPPPFRANFGISLTREKFFWEGWEDANKREGSRGDCALVSKTTSQGGKAAIENNCHHPPLGIRFGEFSVKQAEVVAYT